MIYLSNCNTIHEIGILGQHICKIYKKGDCDRDRLVVGFTTTYATSSYHNKSCEFESHSCLGSFTEAHQLRVCVRKQSGYITIVRSELQDMNEGSLLPSDIKNAALSLYIERRKHMPALPTGRTEGQDAIHILSLETNKFEHFVLVNDKDSEIVYSASQSSNTI